MFQKFMLKLFNFLLLFIIIANNVNVFSQENHKIYYNDKINDISLKEKQNPLIFVDFWATWCAPCIASMPHTQNLQNKTRYITFVYITNEPSFKAKNFLQRQDYNFHVLIDNDQRTSDEFKVHSIPQSFLIGPEGEIVWHGKPTEISLDDLLFFEEQYQNQKGNQSRFVYTKPDSTQEKWQEFHSKVELLNRKTDFARNIYLTDNDSQFLSGDLTYVFSFVFDIPEKQIENRLSNDYLEFKTTETNTKLFKKAIKSFLKKNYPYKLNSKRIPIKTYIAREQPDNNFLSKNMFDFEKGDAQFLKGEISIKIDNATPEQMFKILSEQTPFNFEYEGNNNNVYDWSIVYETKKLLLQQLTDELGFEIKEKEHYINFYVLQRK